MGFFKVIAYILLPLLAFPKISYAEDTNSYQGQEINHNFGSFANANSQKELSAKTQNEADISPSLPTKEQQGKISDTSNLDNPANTNTTKDKDENSFDAKNSIKNPAAISPPESDITSISQFSKISNEAKDLQAEHTIKLPKKDNNESLTQFPTSNPTKIQTEDNTPSPLLEQPTRLVNLETANQLPAGTFQLNIGTQQTLSANQNRGTGFQLYYIGADWAKTDNLQLGLSVDSYDDPVPRPINGQYPNLTISSFVPSIKYQIFKDENLAVSVTGAAGYTLLQTTPGFFNNRPANPSANQIPVSVFSGALQFPISYNVNPKLQLHLTPGVAFFPNKVNGADFFGTFFNLGAGLSWQALDRLNLFANAIVPFGSGGNSINSQNNIDKKLLWTVGTRYNVDPRVAVEAYATNAFGATPTTGLLAFIPDGNQFVLGANLKYLFDSGKNYASSFRPKPALTNRDRSLMLDGFTLSSADTLEANIIHLTTGLKTGGNSSLLFAYSLSDNLQFEIPIEQYGGGDKFSEIQTAGPGVKYGPGAKIRFLNQAQGDPFSLSLKVLGTVDFQTKADVGTLYAELPIVYQPSPQTALFFNPKGAFNGIITRTGLGLGINQAISDKFQLIGEFTPVFSGQRSVWSAGVRYFEPQAKFGVDVYASNAIGQSGLGGLVGESGTNVGFNFHWLFTSDR